MSAVTSGNHQERFTLVDAADIPETRNALSPSRKSLPAFVGCWFAWLFATLSILTAALPLIPTDIWWIRFGDFPRVQLAIIHVLAILPLLFLLRSVFTRILIGLLAISFAIQIYWIFPYLPFAAREVESARQSDPDRRITMLVSNVLQPNDDAEALLKLIDKCDADVVALCEVNQRWMQDLESLNSRYPNHIAEPRENKYGMALWTRLPLEDAVVRYFVSDEIPSLDVSVRLKAGDSARIFVVHPQPPSPFVDTTERDAELVLVGRELEGVHPAIVVGDINDVAWSRTTNLFQEVSGLLDPRKGRGFFPTYRSDSWIVRYPLDYLFHSDDFRVAKLKTLPSIGSDHLPLFVELSYEPNSKATQEGPQLDAGDIDDAKDAVESAKKKETLVD